MPHLRTWMLLTLAASCCALAAQTLEVTKSPVSVDTEYLQSGAAFDHALVALRYEATGGDVDLYGFALEPDGATFDTDVTDLACWLDDGDGLFDDQADTLLWSGDPVMPDTAVTFAAPVTVANGTYEDVWFVASFAPDAGSSLGKSYAIALGSAAQVDANGASVVIGTPLPESSLVKLVYFEVESKMFHGYLELHGSGFTPPFTVTVNGVSYDYPAPTGALTTYWSPWGSATWGPDSVYLLLDDHSGIRFYRAYENGTWRDWKDILTDDTMVSVQITTASSGPHDLGMLKYFHHVQAVHGGTSGESGGCAASDADSGLPFGVALILLALSLKAVVVNARLDSPACKGRGSGSVHVHTTGTGRDAVIMHTQHPRDSRPGLNRPATAGDRGVCTRIQRASVVTP